MLAAIAEAEAAQAALRAVNVTLELQVQQRTAHLEIANKNLATIAYPPPTTCVPRCGRSAGSRNS